MAVPPTCLRLSSLIFASGVHVLNFRSGHSQEFGRIVVAPCLGSFVVMQHAKDKVR